MSFEIIYGKNQVVPMEGETVLEAFERTGVIIPSSCRAGVCQFCMVKAVKGEVPRQAQEGLKPTLQASGHFLACLCRATGPLVCEPAFTADFRGRVSIEEITPIGIDIVAVKFSKPEEFAYIPGQFVTFRLDSGHARSYSIASDLGEETKTFEIHVRRIKNGVMSTWFHDHAQPRNELWMEGPKGDCIYYPGNPEEHLVLVGTGTGMAPLLAVARDAISKGHLGPISVLQGAVTEDRLYLLDDFANLAANNSQFKYKNYVIEGHGSNEVMVGDLKKIALQEMNRDEVGRQRFYLCGDPGLVRHLKKQFFLNGVSLKNLHADPFIGTDV